MRSAVRAAAGADATVVTGERQVATQVRMLTGGTVGLTAVLLSFAGLAVVVAGLVIANTFGVLLAQRTRELALLRCIGATSRQVRRTVLTEAFVVGLVASALGAAVGVALAAVASFVVGRLGSPLPLTEALGAAVRRRGRPGGRGGDGRRGRRRPRPRRHPGAAARRPAPARDGVRAQPARRRPHGAGVARAGRRRAGAAARHVHVAAARGHGRRGAEPSWRSCSSASLFVPPVVGLAGRLARRLGGVPATLAAGNSVRNPRRTAATTTALLVGVTLVSMALVGVASTRATTQAALDGRFPTDVVVTADTDLPPTLPARIESLDGVARVAALPGARVTGPRGEPVRAVALDHAADPVLRDQVVQVPAAGTAVAPPWLLSTWDADPGDRVTLHVGDRRVQVLVRSDDDAADLLLAPSDLHRLAPAASARALWVRLDGGLTDTDAVSRTVSRTALAAASDAQVMSPAMERDALDSVLDGLLIAVTALLGVAVLIALVGVGNTLALSVWERQQESGLLRALGLPRRGLHRMLLWEAALVSGTASVLGLALGAAYGVAGTAAALGPLGDVHAVLPWGRCCSASPSPPRPACSPRCCPPAAPPAPHPSPPSPPPPERPPHAESVSGGGAGRAADDELGAEQVLGTRCGLAGDLVDQRAHRRLAHAVDGLAQGGQRRVGEPEQQRVVVADHRHVAGHRQAELAGGAHRTERHQVGAADHGRAAARDQPHRCRLPTLDAEQRPLDARVAAAGHQRGHRLAEPGDLADGGHEAVGPHRQPDPGVPQRDQVRDGEPRGGLVVARDARRLDVVRVAVDQHDRQPAGQERPVPLVVGQRVGVQPRHEHDAADAALEQHLRVVVLVDAAGRLRAQHRRVPVPGQRRLDRLGERREDRVGQARARSARRDRRSCGATGWAARSPARRAPSAPPAGSRRRRRVSRSAPG
ncbi:hypothetical protein GCM10025868_28690 [Angustibacter aerolatus]|uniref:ABC3 transporter permease C-terminal domain-containing protein n=1 Tax=Angustibacter aerolatus TaxID=1162965 RepID=A0ABQ6JKF7_9ACTN|nr:FtsX family ABC transporter permease [Angustibacter aerolatus]GMA87619.1 hypothetical protein GCM10025868_28690 [Angustibacter aerolatus]